MTPPSSLPVAVCRLSIRCRRWTGRRTLPSWGDRTVRYRTLCFIDRFVPRASALPARVPGEALPKVPHLFLVVEPRSVPDERGVAAARQGYDDKWEPRCSGQEGSHAGAFFDHGCSLLQKVGQPAAVLYFIT